MLVWPKNDQMRKLLRHPHGKTAFPPQGPADWPDDSFTARRIADGDVSLEETKTKPPAPPPPPGPEPKTMPKAPDTESK